MPRLAPKPSRGIFFGAVLTLSVARHANRAALDSNTERTDLVQKLLVESGCRMSQRRDDFWLIALASGQPWRFAIQSLRRRPRTPPTSTSAAGCACAALCLQ